MTHTPILVGQINDGIEPQYPGSDVEPLSHYVQALMGVELDRRLSDQLPGWIISQGAVGTDNSNIGIALNPEMGFEVVGIRWERMATWKKTGGAAVLVVQVDFAGCPLSFISAHRTGSKQVSNRVVYDRNLAAVVKAEKQAGRLPIVGIDANEADPQDLATQVGLIWVAPFPGSIVGLLIPTRVDCLAVTSLAKDGEHPPVVTMLSVPDLT